MTHDIVLRALIERGWALTRANYLALAHLSEPLGPEIEAGLPLEVRHVTGRRAARREVAALVERLRLE